MLIPIKLETFLDNIDPYKLHVYEYHSNKIYSEKKYLVTPKR